MDHPKGDRHRWRESTFDPVSILMNRISCFPLQLIVVSFAICACVACGQSASNSGNRANPSVNPSGDSPDSSDIDKWVKNGATACDKYLTRDLINSIFSDPNGQSHAQDAQTCIFEAAHQPNQDFSTIWISLSDGSNSAFETNSTTINGSPLAGVGDKAVRTREDGVQALKRDRMCAIWVKPPFGSKLKGDAMARKLGEVCTQLFGLP